MLRWFDSAIPYTGGRTPRELIILGGGVALCVHGLTSGYVDVGNLCVYAGATLVFALLAATSAAIATPFTLRLLRRTLFGASASSE